MERVFPQWSLEPLVDSLVALRGIDKLAELGDISRFDSSKQLMAFLGLVSSQHISGGRRWWLYSCHEMPKVRQAAR